MSDPTTDEFTRIRLRLLDLQKTGLLHPDAFGTYQQTILQLYQDATRRRESLLQQGATLRQQAAAAEAQAGAFSVMGSMLYNVVNGYIESENKRIQEMQAKEIMATGGAPTHSASGEPYEQAEAVVPEPKVTEKKPSKKR